MVSNSPRNMNLPLSSRLMSSQSRVNCRAGLIFTDSLFFLWWILPHKFRIHHGRVICRNGNRKGDDFIKTYQTSLAGVIDGSTYACDPRRHNGPVIRLAEPVQKFKAAQKSVSATALKLAERSARGIKHLFSFQPRSAANQNQECQANNSCHERG